MVSVSKIQMFQKTSVNNTQKKQRINPKLPYLANDSVSFTGKKDFALAIYIPEKYQDLIFKATDFLFNNVKLTQTNRKTTQKMYSINEIENLKIGINALKDTFGANMKTYKTEKDFDKFIANTLYYQTADRVCIQGPDANFKYIPEEAKIVAPVVHTLMENLPIKNDMVSVEMQKVLDKKLSKTSIFSANGKNVSIKKIPREYDKKINDYLITLL